MIALEDTVWYLLREHLSERTATLPYQSVR
jgi:hypothetical protein